MTNEYVYIDLCDYEFESRKLRDPAGSEQKKEAKTSFEIKNKTLLKLFLDLFFLV